MIGKNLLWDYFGRFASMAMQMITSIVLAKILGPEKFGLVGLTLTINALVSVLTSFGFSSYIIQQKEEDNELISSIFWFNFFLGFFLSTSIFLISPYISSYYKEPNLTPLLKVNCWAILISLLVTVPTCLLSKRLKFKEINIRNIIISILSGLVGICLALLDYGAWALVIQQILNLSLNLIFSFKLSKWLPKFLFSKYKFLGAFNFGKYIFSATIIEGLYSRLDALTIGKIFSIVELGLFSRAQSFMGTIVNLSSQSILNVLFPSITPHKDNKEKLVELYYTFFHHILFITCVLGTILFTLAHPTFHLILDEKWKGSASYFQIMSLYCYTIPISSLMLTFIEGRGNSKNYFYADVIKKFVLYPTFIVLYFFGVTTYLYVTIFAMILAISVNLFFLNKEIDTGYKKTTSLFFSYVLSSLGIAFCLDKIFPTDVNWIFASLKLFLILTIFFTICHKKNYPTLKILINKINKK